MSSTAEVPRSEVRTSKPNSLNDIYGGLEEARTLTTRAHCRKAMLAAAALGMAIDRLDEVRPALRSVFAVVEWNRGLSHYLKSDTADWMRRLNRIRAEMAEKRETCEKILADSSSD